MSVLYTGNQTDVAIKGDGFFVVGSTNASEIFYTRKGDFVLDVHDFLVTKSGHFVLDKTNKPIIYFNQNDLKNIAIVCFENLEELTRVEDALYSSSENAKYNYSEVNCIIENALEDDTYDFAEEFVKLLKEQK